MTEEQIKLLKKALELYGFVVAQNFDQPDVNEYFEMREKLSELIGADVT